MSASSKKRRRRQRRKILERIERTSLDDSWERFGPLCSAGRRSAWMRVVYREAVPGYPRTRDDAERIEIRAGREGDDFAMVIDRSNPQFQGLLELFYTMQFAAEN